MKFLLAAAALMVGVTAKPGGVRTINKKAASPKLMSKSMKYSDFIAKHGKNKAGSFPGARKLNDEFEITGDYRITPQQCLTFYVDSEDLYDENIIAYAAGEEAKAEKSFVLFNIVNEQYAYYEDGADDDQYLWIAPLGDFMGAMAQYKGAVRENYCEACNQAEEYCGYGDQNQDQEENQEEEENEDDEEGRKLEKNYVNCNTCTAYNCWEDENENQNQNDNMMDDEELYEYVAQIGECVETGYYANAPKNGYYNNNNGRKLEQEAVELKAGFMCGPYGPEIALFLDDDCSIYYTGSDYYSMAAQGGNNAYYNNNGEERKLEDVLYITSSQMDTIIDSIGSPYQDGISCAAFPEFDEYNEDGEDEEEDQNEDEEAEANEICQAIMEAEAVPIATCGYDNGEEEEDAEEEEEEQREGNYYNFEWQYELSEDDADDIQAVCTYYNTHAWEAEDWHGNIYEGEVHFEPESTTSFSTLGGLSAGAKFGIAVAVLAVVGGIAFLVVRKKKSADDYKLEPLHDSKGTSA